jgi:hypothetical protein
MTARRTTSALAFPERCASDVLDFLGRRFGLGK